MGTHDTLRQSTDLTASKSPVGEPHTPDGQFTTDLQVCVLAQGGSLLVLGLPSGVPRTSSSRRLGDVVLSSVVLPCAADR